MRKGLPTHRTRIREIHRTRINVLDPTLTGLQIHQVLEIPWILVIFPVIEHIPLKIRADSMNHSIVNYLLIHQQPTETKTTNCMGRPLANGHLVHKTLTTKRKPLVSDSEFHLHRIHQLQETPTTKINPEAMYRNIMIAKATPIPTVTGIHREQSHLMELDGNRILRNRTIRRLTAIPTARTI